MEDLYSEEERQRDDEKCDALEQDYENETDPVKKAEKEIYFHYFYESRRQKSIAANFKYMIEHNSEEDVLDDTVQYIYMDHLFGGCDICKHKHMWAEKPWAEALAKKLGKETWKEIVAKLEDKMEDKNDE